MIKVLVNAYACSPYMGSEPGMAWNWCVNLAKSCELFIITEEEFREKIETVVPTLPQGKNMHFYYNPVTPEVRKMCWNQGDWRFYWHYRQWQKRTLEIARKICAEQKIDILHQLNMIGYREPGLLWKIKGPKFVWGPVGGMETMPIAYLKGAGPKTILFNRLKNLINSLQYRYQPNVQNAVKRADAIIAATSGCQKKLQDFSSWYFNKTANQFYFDKLNTELSIDKKSMVVVTASTWGMNGSENYNWFISEDSITWKKSDLSTTKILTLPYEYKHLAYIDQTHTLHYIPYFQ